VDLNGDGNPDGVLQQTFRGDPTQFNLYYYEGTSMAAPHISGVAGLLFARNPAATASQVRQAMETTALDLGPAGRDNEYGNGLVQAANALAAIGGLHSHVPESRPVTDADFHDNAADGNPDTDFYAPSGSRGYYHQWRLRKRWWLDLQPYPPSGQLQHPGGSRRHAFCSRGYCGRD
jgi:hypothetical protein